MKCYMVGYDLNKSGKDYDGLIEAIKDVATTWWHYLDSTWIITSNRTAESIRDRLMSHIDSDDELLVARLSGEAAWYGFEKKGSDWLMSNLPTPVSA